MKNTLLAILICFNALFFTQSHAANVDTLKVYTGVRGGVVTVKKQVYTNRNDKRITKGYITTSDILLDISGNDTVEPETTDAEEAAVDIDPDSTSLVSGRIRFKGGRFEDEPIVLNLNGAFRSLVPQGNTLILQGISATRTDDGVTLAGAVIINDVEYELEAAPENIQRFVRRLLIWIQLQ